MFSDKEFECGQEFTSDFLSSIKSRLYLPDNNIVEYGENFNELIMIQDGIVNLNIRWRKRNTNDENGNNIPEPKDYHFFVLPTYSYFGDY
jgi:hypothetical protein